MPSIDYAQIEIERAHYDNLFDPITGLPTGWLLLIDRLEVADPEKIMRSAPAQIRGD